jgi:hypothetical protein
VMADMAFTGVALEARPRTPLSASSYVLDLHVCSFVGSLNLPRLTVIDLEDLRQLWKLRRLKVAGKR